MFRNQYDNDNTTWSPQGRLLQVEYATEAVKQGSISLGLVNSSHAILLALRRSPGDLASYQKKILPVDGHVGIAISGLTSDARVLNTFMRSESLNERMTFGKPISIFRLASAVGDKAQLNTQQYGGRPYGVGLLIAGHDETGPHLYECSPTGYFTEYSGMAIGARSQPARTYLEKHLSSFSSNNLEELIVHGLKALRDALTQDATLSSLNTSISVVGEGKPFEILSDEEVDRYLKLLPQLTGGAIVRNSNEEEAAQGDGMEIAESTGVTPPLSHMDVE